MLRTYNESVDVIQCESRLDSSTDAQEGNQCDHGDGYAKGPSWSFGINKLVVYQLYQRLCVARSFQNGSRLIYLKCDRFLK